MKILYDLFFMIFSLAYIPYLLIRGKWHRGFFQKLGLLPKDITKFIRPVWIHAVSVGEAVLAVKLAKAIKNRQKDIPIVVSTTTSTGNEIARKSGYGIVDLVFYYPMDISFIVSRVVRMLKPRMYVMVETELWPNLLEELSSKSIPVILANGRISDPSFRNYLMIKPVINRILGCIDLFCMQSDQDAARIKQLGAIEDKVFVTGNMKFSEQLPDDISGFRRTMLGFSDDDKIIIAGSTHSPEEKKLIDIFKQLKTEQEGLKLIIAPRHVERTDEIKRYIRKKGLEYRLFSEMFKKEGFPPEAGQPPAERTTDHGSRATGHGPRSTSYGDFEVLLVDTIGHLKDIYSLADIVFVGGSITKRGGQNPIEAAKWRKAIIFGPHMFNFKEMSDIFVKNNAAVRVADLKELKSTIHEMLKDPDKRREISGNSRKVISDNSGAINETMRLINKYL